MAHNGSDAAWFDSEPPAPSRPRPRGMRYSSRYLTMRDGVRIAISRYLPEGMTYDERLPTILHQTRYYRSMELRQPMRTAAGGQTFHHIPLAARTRKRFVANGYGWIDVDVRGSGASYGTRLCEWSPDEIRDSAEIVDWIIGQPWSNGIVGALGTSYNGAAAEFVAANRHPAVRAIAPRFSPFDAYTDIAFPGGIHAAWFTETWGRYNDALDRNAPEEVVGRWLKLLVTGVQPVQGDEDRALRAGAIAAHVANYDVHEQALSLTFRDDIAVSDPYQGDRGVRLDPIGTPIDDAGSINLFSPHNYWRAVEASGVPVYNYSGWFDGGYAHSAIKRFLTNATAGSRLILGPWNHGGRWHIDPAGKPATSAFDHDGELLRFFDRHLRQRDTGIDAEPRVHYFTMVQNRWKAADSWPPPADTLSYFLSAHRGLGLEPTDSDSGADEYLADLSAGTGEHSRWHTQVAIGAAVRYPDRDAQDAKLLTYTSAAIGPALEVTGHPIVTLYVTANASDATIFVYLEDIDARGHATYVTEGQLRAINRRLSDAPPPYRQPVPYRTFKRGDAQPLVVGEVAELTFDLLPTSYLFGPGHRIRIAIAGADASHFAVLPGGPPTLTVHRSRLHASRLDLPVVRR